MIAPTEIQTILQNGKPAFVVIPYREYLRLVPDATKRIPAGDAVPHEVMRYVLREDFSLARAWREYLGYTQVDVAARMGINGTPHFLVGDRSIPGAPENLLEQIKKNVAELRKDGCKVC